MFAQRSDRDRAARAEEIKRSQDRQILKEDDNRRLFVIKERKRRAEKQIIRDPVPEKAPEGIRSDGQKNAFGGFDEG